MEFEKLVEMITNQIARIKRPMTDNNNKEIVQKNRDDLNLIQQDLLVLGINIYNVNGNLKSFQTIMEEIKSVYNNK